MSATSASSGVRRRSSSRRRYSWTASGARPLATSSQAPPGILPTNVFEGQTVEVCGVIQPPGGPVADGMFDARAFYKRESVFPIADPHGR